jgi:uncharacterized protein
LLNGSPIQTAELHPDAREDRLVLGAISLWVHASGERLTIRMKDKNSKLRKSFSGTNWFPIDQSYHVMAHYTAYPQPKQLDSQNILGDPIKLDITGYLSFARHGQNLRLEVETVRTGGFFIVFRDLTSGKETYPASRFIDTDPPKDTPPARRSISISTRPTILPVPTTLTPRVRFPCLAIACKLPFLQAKSFISTTTGSAGFSLCP